MRTTKLSCALLLLLEGMLALVFLGGLSWCGGWRAGLLCSASLLVLVCLPWLGDLELDYDSDSGNLRIVLGWWGGILLEGKPATLRLRLLGITFRPWRRTPSSSRAAPSPPPSEATTAPEESSPPTPPLARAREAAEWAGENVDGVVRLFLSSVQAGHELIWGAKELQVKIQSPMQYQWADLALASIVRDRKVGPVDLQYTALGERRIRVHYRAAMLSVGVLGLAFLAEGRPRCLLAAWKRERGRA